MRYKLRLDACPATSRSFWGRTIAMADRLVDLPKTVQIGFGLMPNQAYSVVDTKTGKIISSAEYEEILRKLAK